MLCTFFFQLITIVFSKVLIGIIFGLNVLFAMIQEQSFRADKLMEFYKVSGYIRMFVMPLSIKKCHLSGWKLLNFDGIMISCLVLCAAIYLLLTSHVFWQSDMKLKKFVHIIENSPVYPVIYDSNR
jgi:uncharacterized membrane protein